MFFQSKETIKIIIAIVPQTVVLGVVRKQIHVKK